MGGDIERQLELKVVADTREVDPYYSAVLCSLLVRSTAPDKNIFRDAHFYS